MTTEEFKKYKHDSVIKRQEACVKRCKILFNNETVYPYECGEGWWDLINELSYKLEVLNIAYKQYGISVNVQQIKEKMGTLHYYRHINIDHIGIARILMSPFYFIRDMLDKVDYAIKNITVSPPFDTEEWEEITEDEYNKKITRNSRNDYGSKFKVENGKFYRNYQLFHGALTTRQCTKHKILFKLRSLFYDVVYGVDMFISNIFKESSEQIVIHEVFSTLVDELIAAYVDKCNNVCEFCGETIFTKNSPAYITHGYVRYLCKDCHNEYEKRSDGSLYDADICYKKSAYVYLNNQEANTEDER